MVLFEHDDDYRVKLPVFEGPIALLLYLIKRKELQIHEISISEIAQEYLDYVEIIKMIDLEKAGDFIVVASTLMKIKSQSLFSSVSEEEDSEKEDIGKMLVNYLIEYDKLGAAADKLVEIENIRRLIYPRAGDKEKIVKHFAEIEEDETQYVAFDLLSALKDVLKNAPVSRPHEIEMYNITPEMKQEEIMEIIEKNGKVDFIGIVKDKPRYLVVVTFIAVLELVKKQAITVHQAKQFGRLLLVKKDDNSGENNEIEDN